MIVIDNQTDTDSSANSTEIGAADSLLLQRAVELAEGGVFSVTSNPRVGCLIEKDGQILGRGLHLRGGDAHAEVNALRDVHACHGDIDLVGATAYVSLEPCCHAGRTGACTDALITAGITRVVVAMLDPHPKVAGDGVAALRAAGVQVDVAPSVQAERLNYGHRKRMLHGLPYIRLKIAQSVDGRTAMASGESKWITGPLARRDVQYWRARSGAVVTGVGTVLADNPSLAVRQDEFAATIDGEIVLRQPLRVVLDSSRRAPPESVIFNDGHPTLWLANQEAPTPAATCEVGSLPSAAAESSTGRLDIKALLGELAQRGCNEILVEAGAALVGAFLEQDLWDEVLVYSAPKFLGSDARPMATLGFASMSQAIEAKIATIDQVGADVRTRLVRADRDLDTFDCVPLGVPEGFLTESA